MAAVTSAIVGGVALAGSIAGSQMQADAARQAGEFNAQTAEENARLAKEKAVEDERRFRNMVRKQYGSNVASIAKSGIRLEGSALQVLRENARVAEEDAINIRRGGDIERARFLTEARFQRVTGSMGAAAANIQGAADTLGALPGVADRFSALGKSS